MYFFLAHFDTLVLLFKYLGLATEIQKSGQQTLHFQILYRMRPFRAPYPKICGRRVIYANPYFLTNEIFFRKL